MLFWSHFKQLRNTTFYFLLNRPDHLIYKTFILQYVNEHEIFALISFKKRSRIFGRSVLLVFPFLFFCFLDATTHLYKRSCPSVRRSSSCFFFSSSSSSSSSSFSFVTWQFSLVDPFSRLEEDLRAFAHQSPDPLLEFTPLIFSLIFIPSLIIGLLLGFFFNKW